MSLLSVIVPAYNEEPMINLTTLKLTTVLNKANICYELLFVDDGSNDKTWFAIQRVANGNPAVRGIHFSRNFGKEAAILAGLSESNGDCVAVMDCDLQHPPEKLVEMYRLWEKGYEIVEGVKTNRGKENCLHSFAANLFYTIISKGSDFNMENASDFKLLDRRAVDVLINMREQNAFFRALSSWIGFKTATVPFQVQERVAGESKWSTYALVKYAINNIASFSTVPMQFVTVLGVAVFLISLIFGVIAIVQKIAGVAKPGFTTIILIMTFSSSIIMISLGIIGYYIARIYEEIKGRPRYIISQTCGNTKDKTHDKEDIG